MRMPFPTILSLALALWGSPAWAVDCALIPAPQPKGAAKPIAKDQAGQTVPLPSALRAGCEGIRVTEGAVIGCAKDSRGRSRCKTFRKNETLTLKNLVQGEGSTGILQNLLDMLTGSSSKVAAVSRGADAAASVLPQGTVVLLDASFAPDFSLPALQHVGALEIRRGGPSGPIVATLKPGAEGPPSVPSSAFQPDQSYWWMAQSQQSGLPESGRFWVATNAERKAARAEMKRIDQSAARDPAASALMKAEWLQDHSYNHDARTLLLQAGFTLP